MSLIQRLDLREVVGVSAVRGSRIGFWPRWILASSAVHFRDRLAGLPMFMEGQEHQEDKPAWAEVRVDGPYILEKSHNYFHVDVEINVLVCTVKDDKNFYNHVTNVGTVTRAFFDPLHVLRLGSTVDDDRGPAMCLVLNRSLDQREAVRVTHFGQVQGQTPILRSSVEGHFHTDING